jgi:hypothetical protein
VSSAVTAQIQLPGRTGPLVIPEPGWAAGYPPPARRKVFAAAHVAASPSPAAGGGEGPVIDWESTMRFRDHLWAHGFGVAEAFDPALRGYWGSTDFDAAAGTVLELIERAGGQVDGIKLSVLDAGQEVALRRRLPSGVRLYTGDDFNYAGLIRGDADGYSDALLGAFAAITAPAAAALAALDEGDMAGYDAAMGPTVPLSRAIFEPPTYHYKVGVAFLAWLNGLQPHFAMLAGLQRRRPARHLIRGRPRRRSGSASPRCSAGADRCGELRRTVASVRMAAIARNLKLT